MRKYDFDGVIGTGTAGFIYVFAISVILVKWFLGILGIQLIIVTKEESRLA